MKKLIIFLFLFATIANTALAQNFVPDPAFNPNFIISDYEITNSGSMNLEQIQNFLVAKGSYLANYYCPDINNNSVSAAQAIYNIAKTNGINPKFLLVLLEKEQSLVSLKNPSTGRLDRATGYGCPDSGGCSDRWKGFYKQVNAASLQFLDYIQKPQMYRYKVGETYTFENKYSTTYKDASIVTPANAATAALYNYTPHVYNGNYNFWKLWRKYFTTTYPSGTLLQAENDSGIWLIQGSSRRAIMVKSALNTRFDAKKIITVKMDILINYSIGTPIRFPQYSIVQDSGKNLYLLVDDQKRLFETRDVFNKLGFNPAEITQANEEDLASYKDGVNITAGETYATGALLMDKKTKQVWWIEAKTKALVDPIYLKTAKFKTKKVITSSAATLNKYNTVGPIKFQDGELVKIDKGFTTYAVENGLLRPISSTETFNNLGFKQENILYINTKVFLTYKTGEPITAN